MADINLKKKYEAAKKAYYEGNPIMSDEEFDKLEEEIGVGAVGSKDKNAKFAHPTKMLSLSKFQSDKTTGKAPTEDTMRWMKLIIDKINEMVDIPSFLPNKFEITCKYDGNSGNCIYIDGKLSQVLTRGDGLRGRDITDKVRHLIPDEIPELSGKTAEVRGEVIMKKSVFNAKYKGKFANPRNLVAGILGRDDNFGVDDLSFVAYEFKCDGLYGTIEYINRIGFNKDNDPLVLDFVYGDDNYNFDDVFNDMSNLRENIDFPLDGMVIKTHPAYRSVLGENDHDPEWGKAIKFKPEGVTTTIKSVSWSIGKTGEFTPVANLDPVDLDGSTVSKVSLYNAGYIDKNKICVGTRVRLVKSGDIIPQIIEVFDSGVEYDPEIIPSACPHCGSTLEYDGIHLTCKDESCSGRKKSGFYERVKYLDVNGIGEVMAYALFGAGIHDPMDMLVTDIKTLEKNGMSITKNVTNVFDQIEKIKCIKLEKLILMLGNVDGIGITTAKQIANKVAGISYDFSGLEKSVVSGWNEHDGKAAALRGWIEKLNAAGISIEFPKEMSSLTGVEFTGSPKPLFETKDAFLSKISERGFSHTKLKDAKYLVTDSYESTSSKMAEAKKKGIEILTYSDFNDKFLR